MHNQGDAFPIVISPQIDGGEEYQDKNDKTLPPKSHNFVAIMPGVPPLTNPLANPTIFEML